MSTVQETTANPFSTLGTSSAITSNVNETTQTFLKLLVTQLQNQDPLNPVDNADFTSQLAQLNTVEGIQNLNATLEGFASQFAAAQVLQAVSMLDRQILVTGNELVFDGSNGVTGGYYLPAGGADSLVITVYNNAGLEVDTIELTDVSSKGYFQWDGTDSEGNELPAGTYSFSLAASVDGQTVTSTELAYHRVTSVERASDGTIIIAAGNSYYLLSDIQEII